MKRTIRLRESELRRMISESVKRILNEETEEQERKRQMEDDWQDLERPMKYYKTSFPGDSKYTQATLGDNFANNWGGAGKTPGALAMDAQLPYVHPYTTQKGGLYKKADTSKWTEPSMKGRGYEGQNAARNFARNIHFDKDEVSGMTPYPYKGKYGPTGRIYGDTDYTNFDDQDYFEDKIKSTDGRWYQDKKDYYKKMKKIAQSLGGKRSKKDDDRSFKRALKAADSRPLHRKGSLNRVGMDESVIRKIVSEAIKGVINEGGHLYYKDEDGNVHTNSKETYRGVPGSIYIWHGEWADPEVIWDGVSLNCEDIEESLWYSYKDDCEENGQEPTNEGYEAWLEEMGTDYIASQLDDLVWAAQGCP